MGIGIIIYGIFKYSLDLLFKAAHSNFTLFSTLFNSIIGGSRYVPNLYSILLSLTFAIFWFFGAKFGPWVGLVIALAGSLLADIDFFSLTFPKFIGLILLSILLVNYNADAKGSSHP